jgi:hypothetical protein
VDYGMVERARCGRVRRAAYSTLQVLTLLLLYIPLGIGGVALLFAAVPRLGVLLEAEAVALTGWTFFLDAVAISAVLFFGSAIIGIVVVVVVPRILGRAIAEPVRVAGLARTGAGGR